MSPGLPQDASAGNRFAGPSLVLFESWTSVLRVVGTCAIGYVAIVFFVRTAGKRSLSRMNAYDFVINVALGSVLATMILSARVPVVNGIVALGALIGLQYAVSWLAFRYAPVHRIVKANAVLLYFRGELQRVQMRAERITEDELRSAVRSQGLRGLDDVEAIVLETTGDISVIAWGKGGRATTLEPLRPAPADTQVRA